VDTLLLISSSEIGSRVVQHRNVIEAAKAAGVTRIVYTSFLHADTSPLSIADDHRATEADLRASGVPFTLLRNGWSTENYTSQVGGALAGGAVLGNAGKGRIASAARADYAGAAVAALTREDTAGRIHELAGDTAYTLSDLAGEISRQTGRSIPYKDLPEQDYAAALASVGLPEPVARLLAGMDVSVSQDALFDDSRQLSSLIGRPTTPLSASVAAALT
jgi:NAD(P)H dehydrogenase (quinone)